MPTKEIKDRVTEELKRTGFLDQIFQIPDFDEKRENDFILQIDAMIEYGIELTEELIERILTVVFATVYTEFDPSLYED